MLSWRGHLRYDLLSRNRSAQAQSHQFSIRAITGMAVRGIRHAFRLTEGHTMIEGWHADDYLILFDEAEAAAISAQYGIDRYLAGHVIVGLKGWDDFLVRGKDGRFATVPTVPLSEKYLAPLNFSISPQQIQVDERFVGKLKWYTTPLIFGGDPLDGENTSWVSLEQHTQLVRWWNDRYLEQA